MIYLNTSELKQLLALTPHNQNIMLVGKHGIGKSKIITDFYTTKSAKVVTLFLGQMSDPGDLIGLLYKDEKTGRTDFLPPDWFPADNQPIILFLDELNRARTEILQTVMDLVLNKTLAGKPLPVGSRVIAAVNEGEEYHLTELDPALVSRFNIYGFRPTADEWLLWAAKQQLDKRVIDFIQENAFLLDDNSELTKQSDLDKTPDRRAWERVSHLLRECTEIDSFAKKAIAGIVGERAAALFGESLKANKLISAKELLEADKLSRPTLLKYDIQQLAIINTSMFRYMETLQCDEDSKMKLLIRMEEYILWLSSNHRSEALAQWITIFETADYPKTNRLIMFGSKTLYTTITTFIKKLGL